MNYKKINGYRYYTLCRFCRHSLGKPIIDLGSVPLAGGFLKSSKDFKKEKLYPLTLGFCKNCYLLQTNQVIPSHILFKNYFYFSSKIKTLVDHFKSTAIELKKFFPKTKRSLVVEIGCNDGSFLKACSELGFKTLGIDPATNIVAPLIKKGISIINDYFNEDVAKKIVETKGQADIIFSSNTMAHIEDMHTVYRGIEKLLSEDGILIFEVHYLGNLISQLQYDFIYHEHQYYYSAHSIMKFIGKFGLELFDIEFIPIHAGSIRVYVQHKKGPRKISKKIKNLLIAEKKQGFLKVNTFKKFNSQIKQKKAQLLNVLKSLKKQKKTIVGYGASGRGTIMLNYCGLDSKYLDYVIDDAPAKQGKFTPGTHLKIVSSKILSTKNRPDFTLLFAWSFWKEVRDRNEEFIKQGGKFIIPLPKVKIV